jgi:hypothetical protein
MLMTHSCSSAHRAHRSSRRASFADLQNVAAFTRVESLVTVKIPETADAASASRCKYALDRLQLSSSSA